MSVSEGMAVFVAGMGVWSWQELGGECGWGRSSDYGVWGWAMGLVPGRWLPELLAWLRVSYLRRPLCPCPPQLCDCSKLILSASLPNLLSFLKRQPPWKAGAGWERGEWEPRGCVYPSTRGQPEWQRPAQHTALASEQFSTRTASRGSCPTSGPHWLHLANEIFPGAGSWGWGWVEWALPLHPRRFSTPLGWTGCSSVIWPPPFSFAICSFPWSPSWYY